MSSQKAHLKPLPAITHQMLPLFLLVSPSISPQIYINCITQLALVSVWCLSDNVRSVGCIPAVRVPVGHSCPLLESTARTNPVYLSVLLLVDTWVVSSVWLLEYCPMVDMSFGACTDTFLF